MAKKDLSKLSAEELRIELAKEQDRSDSLQREKEQRDERDVQERREREQRESRTRADAEASRNAEPTEDQWVKLESEYDMTRDEIKKSWKLIQRTTLPLQAKLATYETRDAATEAVRLAKEGIKAEDPQFPKFERFVDEYLGDVPLAEKADAERLKRHMDRAVHYARGKARSTDKTFREDPENTREAGQTDEEKSNSEQGFGEFAIAGMPLTITNDKLVPDDFRKRHQHPEQKEGVRMNERSRWNDGVPKKPR
jgi:hypothetical protein